MAGTFRIMNMGRQAITIGLGMGLLAALLLLGVDLLHRQRLTQKLRADAAYYGGLLAQALAEQAALQLDNRTKLAKLVQTFAKLQQSILYVKLVLKGELLSEQLAPEAGPLTFPTVAGAELYPSGMRVILVRLPSGLEVLDVVRALPERSPTAERAEPDERPSYVRLGVSLAHVQRAAAQELRSAGLRAAAGFAVVATLSSILVAFLARLRPYRARHKTLELGELVIDDVRKEVRVRRQLVPLSPKEYELLKLLASQPGRVFSSQEILQALWGEGGYASAKDVKQYIYLLRQKLEQDPKHPEIIETVKGFGYRLTGF